MKWDRFVLMGSVISPLRSLINFIGYFFRNVILKTILKELTMKDYIYEYLWQNLNIYLIELFECMSNYLINIYSLQIVQKLYLF